MRVKSILIGFCLLGFPLIGLAQFNIEVGAGGGGANYLGEIGGKEKAARPFVRDMQMSQTRQAGTVFYRYRLSPNFYTKASFTALKIMGSDQLSTNRGRAGRNLSFQNTIYELALTGQYAYYSVNDIFNNVKWKQRVDFSTYVFGGIAGFHHNPKARYEGQLIALRPLKTEGQDRPYRQFEVALPIGLGMHYTYRKRHRLTFEIGWRMTFTDYLDDISTNYAPPEKLQDPLAIAMANRRKEASKDLPNPLHYEPGQKRGDPSNNDSYFVASVTYSWLMRDRHNYYSSNYYTIGRRKKKFIF